jgi:hypothetical protein
VSLSRVRSIANEGKGEGVQILTYQTSRYCAETKIIETSVVMSELLMTSGNETVEAYRYFRPGVGTTEGDKNSTREARSVRPTKGCNF